MCVAGVTLEKPLDVSRTWSRISGNKNASGVFEAALIPRIQERLPFYPGRDGEQSLSSSLGGTRLFVRVVLESGFLLLQ